MEIDKIDGMIQTSPDCTKCGEMLRPNIQLKNDLDFVEAETLTETRSFEQFLSENKRRSFTILEIGAGTAQPLAREIARLKFLNDKYKTTLIRINPIKERTGQYNWEKEQFEKISVQH